MFICVPISVSSYSCLSLTKKEKRGKKSVSSYSSYTYFLFSHNLDQVSQVVSISCFVTDQGPLGEATTT